MSIAHNKVQTKLTKGLLDLIILQLLDNHPMHGYELIVKIRKFYGVKFGASTIYPMLNTMEKKHFVKCQWNMNGERPKKIYSLTGNGKSILEFSTESLKAICRTIDLKNSHANEENLHFNVAQGSSKDREPYAV